MGRGSERPLTCIQCGKLFKHKRMESKGYIHEAFLHKATGECGTRQRAYEAEQAERTESGRASTGDMMTLWLEVAAPLIERIDSNKAEIEELTDECNEYPLSVVGSFLIQLFKSNRNV